MKCNTVRAAAPSSCSHSLLILAGWLLVVVGVCSGQGQAPTSVLPPLDETLGDPDMLSSQLTVRVRQFHFEGNTAFSDEELAELLKRFLHRPLTSEDLEEARLKLTKLYIDQGYINSGAVLPDQKIHRRELTFKIVEGTLTDVRVTGNEWLASHYVANRIHTSAGPPLNLVTLKNQLELLRDNPNIERVNAELKPGASPGESYLDVAVEEADQFHMGLRFDNHRSPSIGAERFNLLINHTNLTGNGDRLYIDYGITKNGLEDIDAAGIDIIDVSYTFPITAYDTTFTFRYARSDSLVVEEPFDELDITSESEDFFIEVRHPFYRTPNTEFAMAIAGARRQNDTFLGGFGRFELTRGSHRGESDVSELSFIQEFVTRDQERAIAARSTFKIGLDIFDPTKAGEGADARFFVWLAQFQYLQRLGDTNNQLIVRVTSQIADNPLLSLNQFAIGGVGTVRGYRENQMVRDNGVVLSLEGRIPLLFDKNGRGMLYLAPFFDVGMGWNDGESEEAQDIASIGLGLLFNVDDTLNMQVYWGYPFRDFDDSEDDVQDLGFHFSVVWFPF